MKHISIPSLISLLQSWTTTERNTPSTSLHSFPRKRTRSLSYSFTVGPGVSSSSSVSSTSSRNPILRRPCRTTLSSHPFLDIPSRHPLHSTKISPFKTLLVSSINSLSDWVSEMDTSSKVAISGVVSREYWLWRIQVAKLPMVSIFRVFLITMSLRTDISAPSQSISGSCNNPTEWKTVP